MICFFIVILSFKSAYVTRSLTTTTTTTQQQRQRQRQRQQRSYLIQVEVRLCFWFRIFVWTSFPTSIFFLPRHLSSSGLFSRPRWRSAVDSSGRAAASWPPSPSGFVIWEMKKNWDNFLKKNFHLSFREQKYFSNFFMRWRYKIWEWPLNFCFLNFGISEMLHSN